MIAKLIYSSYHPVFVWNEILTCDIFSEREKDPIWLQSAYSDNLYLNVSHLTNDHAVYSVGRQQKTCNQFYSYQLNHPSIVMHVDAHTDNLVYGEKMEDNCRRIVQNGDPLTSKFAKLIRDHKHNNCEAFCINPKNIDIKYRMQWQIAHQCNPLNVTARNLSKKHTFNYVYFVYLFFFFFRNDRLFSFYFFIFNLLCCAFLCHSTF